MAQNARVEVVMDPAWMKRVDEAADYYAVGPLAADIADDANQRAPGGLSGSYGVARPEQLVRHVGSSKPHADFVERGTRPHVIVPRRARALWWPGAAHPVARVNHPGTRAQPHLRPAAYTQREQPRNAPGSA